jgi:hypothetical protein
MIVFENARAHFFRLRKLRVGVRTVEVSDYLPNDPEFDFEAACALPLNLLSELDLEVFDVAV